MFYAFFIASATRSPISWYGMIFFGVMTSVIAISVFTNYFISGLRFESLEYNTVRMGIVGGPFYNLFIAFYYFSGIYGVAKIINAYRQSKGEFRSQLNYLLAATFVAFSASFVYFPLLFGFKIIPIDNWILTWYTILMFYAITKHELMDIRLVITKAAAYGAVGFLLIASFAVLYGLGLPPTINMIASVVLALFWAYAAHRLREFIQTPLEEKWITDWYDPVKLVNRIATRLIPVMEKEEAFRIIAEELKSAIRISQVRADLGKEHAYAAVTQTRDGLVVPLSSSAGPEGVLVLGPKISEDPYDEKDRTAFTTIMVQARAIFDRIRPYEQVKRELEATAEKLERSQRLAALGTTIAGVAHEIRNPLGIIHATAEELTDKPRTVEELKPLQESMLRNSRRISSIISNMLGLAKSKSKNYAPLDLNRVVEEVLGLVTISRIRLVKELQPVPAVKGDADELKQVLINLISNALEAMPEEGTLTLKTCLAGARVCLEISDTGKGIPEGDQQKIFDPFYSTRHDGAGLGLSIVYRIVREHGADIEVKSAPGRGAAFLVRFPPVS